MIATAFSSLGLTAAIAVAGMLVLRWMFFGRWAACGMAAGIALILAGPLVFVVSHSFAAAMTAGLAGAVLFAAGLAAHTRRERGRQ